MNDEIRSSPARKVAIPFARAVRFLLPEIMAGLLETCDLVLPAGSFRRGKGVLGDLDFIVILKDGVKDTQFFTRCEGVFKSPAVLGGKEGARKAQYYTDQGELVDFYLCEAGALEPMLLFLTGSAELNKKMRAVAKRRGLALNQYGLFERDSKKPVGEQTERGIFETLGLPYLEPSQR